MVGRPQVMVYQGTYVQKNMATQCMGGGRPQVMVYLITHIQINLAT